jgi:hypothetical protein
MMHGMVAGITADRAVERTETESTGGTIGTEPIAIIAIVPTAITAIDTLGRTDIVGPCGLNCQVLEP